MTKQGLNYSDRYVNGGDSHKPSSRHLLFIVLTAFIFVFNAPIFSSGAFAANNRTYNWIDCTDSSGHWNMIDCPLDQCDPHVDVTIRGEYMRDCTWQEAEYGPDMCNIESLLIYQPKNTDQKFDVWCESDTPFVRNAWTERLICGAHRFPAPGLEGFYTAWPYPNNGTFGMTHLCLLTDFVDPNIVLCLAGSTTIAHFVGPEDNEAPTVTFTPPGDQTYLANGNPETIAVQARNCEYETIGWSPSMTIDPIPQDPNCITFEDLGYGELVTRNGNIHIDPQACEVESYDVTVYATDQSGLVGNESATYTIQANQSEGKGYIYIVDEPNSKVDILDPADERKAGEVRNLSDPIDLAPVRFGGKSYMAVLSRNNQSPKLELIDIKTQQLSGIEALLSDIPPNKNVYTVKNPDAPDTVVVGAQDGVLRVRFTESGYVQSWTNTIDRGLGHNNIALAFTDKWFIGANTPNQVTVIADRNRGGYGTRQMDTKEPKDLNILKIDQGNNQTTDYLMGVLDDQSNGTVAMIVPNEDTNQYQEKTIPNICNPRAIYTAKNGKSYVLANKCT
ncbi:MAG: hypothetical protein COV74_00705 [Candidatus Omnitrophica bacterium CG11_big_fil_rev_8_21_14_0_20_45_26]|uniref:Uncharacterized protein n=1 Tax=Candidatus Abzuiibacterium crystallinum TaxID=1974748 RepID=A0A2H0LSW6_9BACT|nr:MAG: hypothetical protein COV74_00705 [Candidatus Omnitrophica bacterium CG11_big_fil_rev_8_21_14_0_20_45_26]